MQGPQCAQQIPNWLPDLLYASRYITCVNTAINPIIYGLCNKNFQKAAYVKFPRLGKTLHDNTATADPPIGTVK